jgi:predicted MPP superfamily phosphohydrolase
VSRPLTFPERFIFRHFFNGLALGGALAEWGIVCWLLDLRAPGPVHVLVVALLALTNRLAARRLEREPATGLLAGRAGHVVLATAFGALMSAGAVAVTAAAWLVAGALGAFRAEAGMVAGLGVDALFGGAFRGVSYVVLAGTALAVTWGYVRGYRQLAVTRLTVPLAGLSPTLAGFRLVHVSDLHLGPLADRTALRETLDRINALEPDVVCVTGDIVDSPATNLASWIPELARLGARHGVFTILGNHDRHVGDERVVAALARWTSWRILRDEMATIEVDGARLHLLGLDDRPWREVADELPALAARVPAGEPAVLLAHRPSVFAPAATAGIGLTLAGHTHGGQVAVPGAPRLNVARVLQTRFDAGLFVRGDALLNVSRGLGTSGQRVRIGVPCEITLVTLVPRIARAA